MIKAQIIIFTSIACESDRGILFKLLKFTIMEETEIIFEFRKAAHREARELLDEDFINNFMFHHNLYGQKIFDRLIEELNNICD